MHDIFEASGLSAGAVYHYFSSKEDLVEAIAEQRHFHETELIAEAMAEPDLNAALHRLADLYFAWVTDSDEQRRRRVGVQVWAEAVHQDRLREIVLRGADQRRLLVDRLDRAKSDGRLALNADPEAITRLYLAIFQGFLLQQAWDRELDVGPYLQVVHELIDATVFEDGPKTATPSKSSGAGK
jgi:AcrR family transcriptional regulator